MSPHGRAAEYLDGTLGAEVEAAFLAHLAQCAACQRELHDEVQLRDREEALRGAERRELHGRAAEYLDGTLGAEVEAAFLAHLAQCAACQRELHDEVQLRDREDTLRAAAGREAAAGVTPPRRRRRGAWWVGGGAAIAAAAAIALWISRPSGTPEVRGPVALALQPMRAIEIRLSHRAAARHRPYDTMRGAAIPREPIAPAVVAELDRAGDCHGVAVAYVLSGEWVRADEQYRRCPAGPDLDADRAGLAVLRGDLDAAIELTDGVLAAAPDHAVALWNRALAMRGLGLELSAATAFERVAVLEEARDAGWAGEARERAAATRTPIERIRQAYEDVARLGPEMIRGGAPLSSDLARQVPGRSRVMLHDAIRTATTAARLDELAPLAAALEGRAGTDLARYLAQARRRLSPARAAASAGYQAISDRPAAVDDRAWARWFELAARAGDDDLILGARIQTGRLDGGPSAEQLAAATRDPWFTLGVGLTRVGLALRGGRIEEAAARLRELQPLCPPGTVTYRCMRLEVELARLAIDRHQPSLAKRHAVTELAMARQLGEWPQRSQALLHAGDAERFGGRFAVARAYSEESGHSRDACGARAAAYTIAEMLFQEHRLAEARARVAEAPACDRAFGTVELTTLVRLLRTGHAVLDRAAVTAKLDEARRSPELARDAAYLDYLTEWVVLDEDPRARARLLRAAERARGIEGSMRDKTINAIDSALFADAGRRAAWGEALAVVARARGVAPPPRCALAIGADDFRFAAVAVGPDGVLAGRYEPDLVRTAGWLAPEPMRRQLAGCAEVAVLALPPWLGIGPVLDPQAPWSYVLGPARPPTTGPRRHVVIADPVPPPEAGLAPLTPRTWPASGGPDELVTGSAATPEQVLAAISDATLVEIHGHTTWSDRLDAPALALSPGAGDWMLRAAQIRAARLTGAPIVVLADCAGGAVARYEHEAWGLPLAFRIAGASAVIASLSEIPDIAATAFFDAVTADLTRGASPAVAVARVRAEKIRTDPTSWMRNVVVFQ